MTDLDTTTAGGRTSVQIPQLSLRGVLGAWAAAALPMGVLAWVVAPLVAGQLSGPAPLARALLACLTAGLVWQFVLVAILIRREQGTLRWSVVREALWLRAPTSPRTGRRGGLLWLVVLALMVAFFASEFLPSLPAVPSHDFGAFLASPAGPAFLHGSWGWFAVLVVLWVFNTVLGEELFFRGYLLPRMAGTFGRWDWLANGVLFAGYHLHVWWSIPRILADAFTLALPSRYYRSSLIGIAVHTSQSVFLCAVVLPLVLAR
jgi:membrane protease YdiL (CAAX protease family)